MWKKLKIDDLPKGEVVAANFLSENGKPDHHNFGQKYIGTIFKVKSGETLIRSSDGCSIRLVTHYLPLPKDEEREG